MVEKEMLGKELSMMRSVKSGKYRILKSCAVLIFSMAFLSGCGAKKIETSTIFAMDTIMELQIEGDQELLTEAEGKIRSLEGLLSVTDEDSDIYKLNENSTFEISDTTADIMSKALNMCDRTGGALDISIYPVLKAWGFTTGEYRVPEDAELESLKTLVDYRQIQLLDNGSDNCSGASIPAGMQVDLGSVAKGYTSSMLYDFFREKGVKSGLINLGGNVQCIGTKPGGEPWKVAIKSPFPDTRSGIYGVLEASDIAIITSGGYERFFEEDGVTYWHILDPETGRPAHSGLASVTIAGRDGLTCDALSTALFVKGLDEATRIWKESSDFEAIFITEEGEVYITEGLSSSFTLSSEYSSAAVHIITK